MSQSGSNKMFYALDSDIEYLEKIGKGNRSGGLRKAIKLAKQVTDDRDPDSLVADATARLERANALLLTAEGVTSALRTEIDSAVLQRTNAQSLIEKRAEKQMARSSSYLDDLVIEGALEVLRQFPVDSDTYQEYEADFPELAAQVVAERAAKAAAEKMKTAAKLPNGWDD